MIGVTILLLNVLLWFVIHTVGAYVPSRFSMETIERVRWLYPIRAWEMGVYKVLKVKKWKEKVPDGGDWAPGGIKKNQINLRTQEGRNRFLLETKRAELSHWLQTLPAPIFFTFNEPTVGIIMILYALAFNLPFIAIQRFNRNRVMVPVTTRKLSNT
ncbi:glycosyl-4,4'-diaponeurosporenoate acyltransferase [Bacillus weihaiensis]|uniref:glycosyl-4,4'-diaponeurosporenoate acyltransferase CrtO family protein n=1 Tax=Bacillus weihaiensis TaxID=1547283 RepID=UPI0023525736|nr:glycosyl-4,4'-diaponeurosporenoate acyltransferase [Bacillus weihaiensis]